MRIQAVLFLLASLVFCSALCQWTIPTTTTSSGAQAAILLFQQYLDLQTNPGPSQSNIPTTTTSSGAQAAILLFQQYLDLQTNPGPSQDPNVCYTDNQEEGKCVKTSMCELPPTKINPSTIFKYRTVTKPTNQPECSSLLICCPEDKIIKNPVPPTASTPPGCGYSNSAVGRFRELTDRGYADFAEFPWMVALLKNSVYNQATVWHNTDYIGGGTLIHPSVVLTVAHKVDTMAARDLKCRAGEWDTESENEVHIHQDREVKKIILHEQFDRQNAYYDAALLIMETPFLLQPHINVACLSQTMPPPGTLCYSMGWGMDFTRGKYNVNVLKKIPLPLVDPDDCESKLKKSILVSNFSLDRSLTCAGGMPNVDTCIGDGGSSLVCPVGDPADLRYTVVGMVVYGLNCGTQDPGAYADVPELYNWVNRHMDREGFLDRLYTI